MRSSTSTQEVLKCFATRKGDVRSTLKNAEGLGRNHQLFCKNKRPRPGHCLYKRQDSSSAALVSPCLSRSAYRCLRWCRRRTKNQSICPTRERGAASVHAEFSDPIVTSAPSSLSCFPISNIAVESKNEFLRNAKLSRVPLTRYPIGKWAWCHMLYAT
jgi:hypothetical protein